MTKRKWIFALILETISICAAIYFYNSETTYALGGCILSGISAICLPIVIIRTLLGNLGAKFKHWLNKK